MQYLVLTVFSIAWILILYALNRLLAGRPLKIDRRKAILYICTMAALGVLGEVTIDTIYTRMVGQPLWLYRLFPIHGGYTSLYSLYEWGMVGFYIYMLHGTLRKKHISSLSALAMIFCADAVGFELAVNGSYRAIFHNYIFYYFPGNLWHLSSLQAIPIYLLAGLITVEILEHERGHFRAAIAVSTGLTICLVGSGILANQI